MMSCEELKAAGNQAFSAGKFKEAIKYFTSAIELDSTNHVLYSNRSAAYASLKEFESALADALKTVELAPKWAKSYSRLASAYHGLDRIEEARESVKKGLEVEPTNVALLKARDELENSSGGNVFLKIFKDPSIWTKIAANPRISHHLADPGFCKRLTTLIQNPTLAMSAISNDQEMLMVLLALMGADFDLSGKEDSDLMSSKADEPAPAAEESNSPSAAAAAAATQERVKQESEEARVESLVQARKEDGNVAYRKKDFDAAMAHYVAAWELSGENESSLLSNMAAVHFERGEWKECIERCRQSIDLARSKRAGYEIVSRALTRMGRAYEKSGDLESAKKAYSEALVEHRTADTLARLNAIEKEISARARAAYQDPELSEAARERGNAHFAAGRYPEAIKEYNEAIKRDEGDVRAYSNRSACYFKLGAPSEAQRDAEKAIQIDPTYIKGYVRKANVLLLRRELNKAIEVCAVAKAQNVAKEGASHEEMALVAKQGLELDGLLQRCYQAVAEQNARLSNSKADSKEREEAIQNAMRDPEVASILRDPQMNTILEQMQSDPKAAREHMSDPTIASKIRKLVTAGVVTAR